MARPPDYKVAILQKDTEEKANIGAAWKNENGTISVILNSFVQITATKQTLITLFPNTGVKAKTSVAKLGGSEVDEDDIPF